MRLYWSLSSIPELASLPKAERKRLWEASYRKIFRHWQIWIALVVSGLCCAVGGQVGKFIAGDSAIVFIVCVMIGGGTGGFIFSQVATTFAIPYIREEVSRSSSTEA